MMSRPSVTKFALAAGFLLVLGAGSVPQAKADPVLDADTQQVLSAMSTYLGGLASFSVDYATADEVLTTDGQKLQFLHGGSMTLRRPGQMHATRKGAAGSADIVLDGKTITLFGKQANAYVQIPAASIDEGVDAIHKLGFDAPGADLIVSKPFDLSTADINTGVHVGMTFIDGIEAHQLAFRGSEVDSQLWVAAGDKPVPLRYVVTTKWTTAAPQFTLELHNWNLAPAIDGTAFSFTPPAGATALDPASVTANAIGDMTIKGK